jgi:hypothetical protein
MPMNRYITAIALVFAALVTSGCVTHETRPLPQVKAVQASVETPPEQLLDVGVRLFDANIPEDEKQQEKRHIFPEVRRAEARFIPMQIRNTLEGTGHWGQVRVMPEDAEALDVYISGVIVESSGQRLELDVTVTDATGHTWFRKTYEQIADTRSYRTTNAPYRDPFQNLYSNLANDLLAYRQKMAGPDLENIRRVSQLKFASDLAPYAFESYLSKDKRKGTYQVLRLPAQDDPMMDRMDRIRERDYALLDTINEHYSLFADNMTEPYTNWRRYSYDELEAKDEAARSALTRKLLGAAAIVGGLMLGNETGSYAGRAAATGAIFGGAYAVKSGFDKSAEVKMHSDSLRQLGESFQAEVQPLIVEVEGRTLQLQGTAEEQFREWRELLKELYENETGLPAQAPATTEASRAAPGSGG